MQFHELTKMSVIDRAFPAKGVYSFLLFDSLFKNFISDPKYLISFISINSYDYFLKIDYQKENYYIKIYRL